MQSLVQECHPRELKPVHAANKADETQWDAFARVTSNLSIDDSLQGAATGKTQRPSGMGAT